MPPTRARSFAAAFLVLFGGLASPTFAGIRADFDRDGVLDTATVVSGERPHIRITLSGADRLVMLPLEQHLSTIVAADLDRDGLTDLAGSSKRRGLFVWRNLGSHRFARVGRHVVPRLVPHGRSAVTLEAGGRRLGHEDPCDCVDLTATGDGKDVALPSVTSLHTIQLLSNRPRLTRLLVPDAVFGRSTAPRAPPIRSL